MHARLFGHEVKNRLHEFPQFKYGTSELSSLIVCEEETLSVYDPGESDGFRHYPRDKLTGLAEFVGTYSLIHGYVDAAWTDKVRMVLIAAARGPAARDAIAAKLLAIQAGEDVLNALAAVPNFSEGSAVVSLLKAQLERIRVVIVQGDTWTDLMAPEGTSTESKRSVTF